MVAITGPSGSGKSTLLHIIAGIDAQTSGVYEYDGNDVRKMSDRGKCELRNKKIGIILQDFGLLGNDTVLRNICLPEIIAGTYKKSFDKKVRVLLQQVGLEGLEHKIMRCDSDSGKKLIKSMVLRTADRQGMC